MSRQKKLGTYPDQYHSSFIMGSVQDVTIICESPTAARNLRNDLYSYRKVFEKYGEPSQAIRMRNVCILLRGNSVLLKPIIKGV